MLQNIEVYKVVPPSHKWVYNPPNSIDIPTKIL